MPFALTINSLGIPNFSRATSRLPTSFLAQYDFRLSFISIGSPIYAALTACFTGTTFIAGFDEVAGGLTIVSSGGLNAPATSVDFDLCRLLTGTSSIGGLNILSTSVDFALNRLLTGDSSGGLNNLSTSTDFALNRLLTGDSSEGLNVLSIGALNALSTSFILIFVAF